MNWLRPKGRADAQIGLHAGLCGTRGKLTTKRVALSRVSAQGRSAFKKRLSAPRQIALLFAIAAWVFGAGGIESSPAQCRTLDVPCPEGFGITSILCVVGCANPFGMSNGNTLPNTPGSQWHAPPDYPGNEAGSAYGRAQHYTNVNMVTPTSRHYARVDPVDPADNRPSIQTAARARVIAKQIRPVDSVPQQTGAPAQPVAYGGDQLGPPLDHPVNHSNGNARRTPPTVGACSPAMAPMSTFTMRSGGSCGPITDPVRAVRKETQRP